MSQNSYQLKGIIELGIAVVKIILIAVVFQVIFYCLRMILKFLHSVQSFKHKELLLELLLLIKVSSKEQLEVFLMP
jgi:hypothetical protein